MSEAEKIRSRVERYCVGSGVDLGCGEEKIVESAVGVDIRETSSVDVMYDISDKLVWIEDEKMDYVFSSHALEHLDKSPVEVLKEWRRILKRDGYLVLYLPHKDYYREVNLEHRWAWSLQDMEEIIKEVGGLEVVESGLDVGSAGRYSFWIVCRKV